MGFGAPAATHDGICEGGRSVAEGEIALHSLANVPEQVLQLVVARQQLEPLLAALVRLAHALHRVQHLGLRPPDLAHTGKAVRPQTPL